MAADPPLPAARLAAVASSPVREILALTAQGDVISLAGGLPSPDTFPADEIRAAFAEALAGDGARRALQYSTTEGHPGLRAAHARRLTARGLPTAGEELLVCTGSQQALGLVCDVLLEPGDTVLVEDPTYLAALQRFGMAGAHVVGVPCDDDGLLPDALETAVREHRPKLLYTMPNFQNPSGRTLPASRRDAIARIAADLGLWILEDDPYGELRYEGSALPPIAALDDAADRTIHISSLSKVLAPGLRLGYTRMPEALRAQLIVAKQAADLHTSTIDQEAAAGAMARLDLDAHLHTVRALYGERRDALLAGLHDALPEGSTWNRPAGGMFVWARLPEGWDATQLLRAAIERGVAFVPGAPFQVGTDPDPRTLRFSFVTHTPDELAEGLRRLGAAAQR
ncbi:PLP-dependent aminotransferase family protein [Svornostia abyssi]|uniref:PLP-dependent aminotransferase family protein n=1 Tax=Svornostia abyssi TaxID=2898438 RepID=A0ABY5PAQ4_9ACTN|nr:PLP-dependent aminotransferase family protein [Parviterribacteraceae bacterium J379]